MTKKFDENRKALADLIYQLGEFSYDELLTEFKNRNNGDVAIDLFQTVKEYLEELVDIGRLRLLHGRYAIVNQKVLSSQAVVAIYLRENGVKRSSVKE